MRERKGLVVLESTDEGDDADFLSFEETLFFLPHFLPYYPLFWEQRRSPASLVRRKRKNGDGGGVPKPEQLGFREGGENTKQIQVRKTARPNFIWSGQEPKR